MSHEALRSMLESLQLQVPLCRRVLLVDDDEGLLTTQRYLLRGEWDVSTAQGGEEALALLEERGPVDLVIADQRMPGIKGTEFLLEVARRYPATMRILLTGHADLEPMLAAARDGLVYRFLLKPVEPPELRAVVRDTMESRAWAMALLELVTVLDRRQRQLEAETVRLREVQAQLLEEGRLAVLSGLVERLYRELENLSASLTLLTSMVSQAQPAAETLVTAQRACAGHAELRDLMRQVRDFTRVATDQPRMRPVPPRVLLTRTMDRFLSEEVGHRCPVLAHRAAHLMPLWCDEEHLQPALLALLRNAARASEPGAPIHIAVSRLASRETRIEVRDEGCGMDPDRLAAVQQPFSSGWVSPGLGLGLEIARLGATAHGGRLVLESALGQGTSAALLLPSAVQGGPHVV